MEGVHGGGGSAWTEGLFGGNAFRESMYGGRGCTPPAFMYSLHPPCIHPSIHSLQLSVCTAWKHWAVELMR